MFASPEARTFVRVCDIVGDTLGFCKGGVDKTVLNGVLYSILSEADPAVKATAPIGDVTGQCRGDEDAHGGEPGAVLASLFPLGAAAHAGHHLSLFFRRGGGSPAPAGHHLPSLFLAKSSTHALHRSPAVRSTSTGCGSRQQLSMPPPSTATQCVECNAFVTLIVEPLPFVIWPPCPCLP